MTAIRILNTSETKDSIDAWFVQVKAFVRAIPVYGKFMDLVWTAHSQSEKEDSSQSLTPPTLLLRLLRHRVHKYLL